MPFVEHDTTFPTLTVNAAGVRDVAVIERMLKEKYERLYPVVAYQMIKRSETPDPTHEGSVGSDPNVSGDTLVDDLWGESEPPGQGSGTAWQNPHTSDLDATVNSQFYDPIDVHVHINPEPTEKELADYAVDEKRTVLIHFLQVILDELEITPRVGDEFFWRDQVHEVMFVDRTGWWKNTTHNLYVKVVCRFTAYGS